VLSRTADALYWLGRYTERAGNVGRGLQVARRMAGLTRSPHGPGGEWHSLLVATGCDVGFATKHAAPVQEAVVRYLTLDMDNPSGIVSCIAAARRNARSVRTALTVDMWEAINDTWIELRRLGDDALRPDGLAPFLDWVKGRSLLFNGAYADTMLRDDAWRFVHLGTMLERADNTARLLDVKHGLLTSREAGEPGGAVEFLQWQAILRSVSALRAYHWVYHAKLQPRLVAELLILRPELPRSMLACHRVVERTLEEIAIANGGRRGECHRLAGELHARLRFGRIDQILAGGLHEFLTEAIDRHLELGHEIAAFYLHA